MEQTVSDNPALGWQDRDGHDERVTVMLRPRHVGSGWTQVVVERAIQSTGGPGSPDSEGVSLRSNRKTWRIATRDLHGRLLVQGDWIGQADGSWWAVQDVGLETGPFGQEQRPVTIKQLGTGGLPWQT